MLGIRLKKARLEVIKIVTFNKKGFYSFPKPMESLHAKEWGFKMDNNWEFTRIDK